MDIEDEFFQLIGAIAIVVVIIICGFWAFSKASNNAASNSGTLPPKPLIHDIVHIVALYDASGQPAYNIMTIDPYSKVVITRHRWFETIIADVEQDKNPWAEIKTRDRTGKGNILHIHSPTEIESHTLPLKAESEVQ